MKFYLPSLSPLSFSYCLCLVFFSLSFFLFVFLFFFFLSLSFAFSLFFSLFFLFLSLTLYTSCVSFMDVWFCSWLCECGLWLACLLLLPVLHPYFCDDWASLCIPSFSLSLYCSVALLHFFVLDPFYFPSLFDFFPCAFSTLFSPPSWFFSFVSSLCLAELGHQVAGLCECGNCLWPCAFVFERGFCPVARLAAILG